MSEQEGCRYIVPSEAVEREAADAAHPWNPEARFRMTPMSQLSGLRHLGVHRVTIPPASESFVYHSHYFEEEWLYVLSGHGVVRIDGEEHAVAAGDFVGFPRRVAHQLTNPSTEPLVYLMGGERKEVEIAEFPDHQRRMLRTGDYWSGTQEVEIYDLDDRKDFESIPEARTRTKRREPGGE